MLTLPEKPRKNLVILTAGTETKIKSWYSKKRSWDLCIISWAGVDYSKFADIYYQGPGIKYQIIYKLFEPYFKAYVDNKPDSPVTPEELKLPYDYILILDDDLELKRGSIDLLFLEAAENGIHIAQPAVDKEGSCVHSFLRKDEGVWESSLVECQMPVMSRKFFALNFISGAMAHSPAGWGLDTHYWQYLCRKLELKMYILANTSFSHTRPMFDGELYNAIGRKKNEELLRTFLVKFKLREYQWIDDYRKIKKIK